MHFYIPPFFLASLGWLSKTQNEISQKDIARDSNTDRMMVSEILRKLQHKEFITRQENQKDTRSKLVSLTVKGKIKLQEGLKQVKVTDGNFFNEIENDHYFKSKLLELISSNLEK